MGGYFGSVARSLGGVGSDTFNAKEMLRQIQTQISAQKLADLKEQLGIKGEQQRQELAPWQTFNAPRADGGQDIHYYNPLTKEDRVVSSSPGLPAPYSDVHVDTNGNLAGRNNRTGNVEELPKQSGVGFAPPGSGTGGTVVSAPGGPPIGIKRRLSNGQVGIVLPGSAEWTDDDAAILKSYKDSYLAGQRDKDRRAQDAMERYAYMRGKVTEYNVFSKKDNAYVMANADTINGDPNNYSAGSLTNLLRSRTAVFADLDTGVKFLNDAIDEIGDAPFDTATRAQLALTLRDRDPASAFQSFLGSELASTLSDAQLDYVTSLVNMQESAMALRSVAGMGQGSDMLRGAIVNMLPGAGTPSGAYAKRQMRLVTAEINALRKSLPPENSLGMGGGGTGDTGVLNYDSQGNPTQ